MRAVLSRAAAPLIAALRREDGSISIEAALIFPMLTWCYLAGFVWFDAFRAQSLNDKAAYAIGDILSRETGDANIAPVTPAYIESLMNLHRVMTFSDKPTRLRVSLIEYDAGNTTHSVIWSSRVGYSNLGDLEDDDIAAGTELGEQIPMMSDGEKLLVVETWLPYEPIFNIGLDAFVFDSFTVISPRYAPTVCFDKLNSGNPLLVTC